jgi:hypothetical protein
MEIKGKITIRIDREETVIDIMDDNAGITFATITLTPEQLSAALSRLSHTDTQKIEVFNLDRVGKKLEVRTFEFELPPELSNWDSNRNDIAEYAQKLLNEEHQGWISDKYFNSQNSFFVRKEVKYARCTARRWI